MQAQLADCALHPSDTARRVMWRENRQTCEAIGPCPDLLGEAIVGEDRHIARSLGIE